jgi:hypothetical protein
MLTKGSAAAVDSVSETGFISGDGTVAVEAALGCRFLTRTFGYI